MRKKLHAWVWEKVSIQSDKWHPVGLNPREEFLSFPKGSCTLPVLWYVIPLIFFCFAWFSWLSKIFLWWRGSAPIFSSFSKVICCQAPFSLSFSLIFPFLLFLLSHSISSPLLTPVLYFSSHLFLIQKENWSLLCKEFVRKTWIYQTYKVCLFE